MIDLFSLMLGAFLTAGIQLLVLLVAFTWRWINRRLDARQERAQPREDPSWGITPKGPSEAGSDPQEAPGIIPRFGRPELLKYRPKDYPEPLRCDSGVSCEGAELIPGEFFVKIPSVGEKNRFWVICKEDVMVHPESYLPLSDEVYGRGTGA